VASVGGKERGRERERKERESEREKRRWVGHPHVELRQSSCASDTHAPLH
jgi:hypothetical protein